MAKSYTLKKLKDARKNAGYTQKDVSEKFNIPQSTISSWEIGKSEPDADTFIKLCKFYGIDSFSYFSDLTANIEAPEPALIFNPAEILPSELFITDDELTRKLQNLDLEKSEMYKLLNLEKITEPWEKRKVLMALIDALPENALQSVMDYTEFLIYKRKNL